MSIFQKRLSAPNQLATLREMESKVNVGKVGKGGSRTGELSVTQDCPPSRL